MLAATFYVHHGLLNYWLPNGALMYIRCDDLEEAKMVVGCSPVKQVIHKNATGDMSSITTIVSSHHGGFW